MRGVFFHIPIVISAFVFVILFTFITLFIYSNIVETHIEEKTFSEELNIKNAAYLIEKCLKSDESFISSDFLEKNKQISCGPKKFRFKVKDLKKEKTWDFGYNQDAKYTYQIFINIMDGFEIHAGRLYVSS